MQTGSVTSEGCALAYDVEGDGPPVLWIQGVGVHGPGWRPQIEAFRSAYRCVSFDNRGLGRSRPAGAPVTVARMADDACRVLDAAGCASAHVVGHSLGGLVAQQVALQARGRVRSLSLLCTFPNGRDATRPTPWMIWVGSRTRVGTRRQRRRAFLQLVLPGDQLRSADREALAERLAPLFGHDLADQPPIVPQQLAALSACDLTPRLPELAGVATLVVSGAFDRIAPPRSGRAIAAGIPGARFELFEDASHGAPIFRAERTNALLREHFEAAEARPSA